MGLGCGAAGMTRHRLVLLDCLSLLIDTSFRKEPIVYGAQPLLELCPIGGPTIDECHRACSIWIVCS